MTLKTRYTIEKKKIKICTNLFRITAVRRRVRPVVVTATPRGRWALIIAASRRSIIITAARRRRRAIVVSMVGRRAAIVPAVVRVHAGAAWAVVIWFVVAVVITARTSFVAIRWEVVVWWAVAPERGASVRITYANVGEQKQTCLMKLKTVNLYLWQWKTAAAI